MRGLLWLLNKHRYMLNNFAETTSEFTRLGKGEHHARSIATRWRYGAMHARRHGAACGSKPPRSVGWSTQRYAQQPLPGCWLRVSPGFRWAVRDRAMDPRCNTRHFRGNALVDSGRSRCLRPNWYAPPSNCCSNAGDRIMTNIAFPFRIDGRGRTALVDDNSHIRDLIEQLLFTNPGERVNRPTFGSGLLALVFQPNS